MALLEKATDICSRREVNAEMVVEVGNPKLSICNEVQKLNINLQLEERGLGKIKKRSISSSSCIVTSISGDHCLQIFFNRGMYHFFDANILARTYGN